MSQWTLFEEVVARERCRNAELKLASKHRHSRYDPDSPYSMPTEKMTAKFSRWMGNLLVTSGEKLLRYAG